jgi:hypothetical protein
VPYYFPLIYIIYVEDDAQSTVKNSPTTSEALVPLPRISNIRAPDKVSVGLLKLHVADNTVEDEINSTIAFCVVAPVLIILPRTVQELAAVIAKEPLSKIVVAPNLTLTFLLVDAVAANVPAASNVTESPLIPKTLAGIEKEFREVSVAAVLPVCVVF